MYEQRHVCWVSVRGKHMLGAQCFINTGSSSCVLFSDRQVWANSVDPDLTAPEEAV